MEWSHTGVNTITYSERKGQNNKIINYSTRNLSGSNYMLRYLYYMYQKATVWIYHSESLLYFFFLPLYYWMYRKRFFKRNFGKLQWITWPFQLSHYTTRPKLQAMEETLLIVEKLGYNWSQCLCGPNRPDPSFSGVGKKGLPSAFF